MPGIALSFGRSSLDDLLRRDACARRAASGATNRRPVLPTPPCRPLPTFDVKASMSGSVARIVGHLLLVPHHVVERDVLRRLGVARDLAGVLVRDEALGHDAVTDSTVADERARRRRPWSATRWRSTPRSVQS